MSLDGANHDVMVKGLRTARKEHTCCECGGTIAKGEVYEYTSGVWEGQGSDFKTCMPDAELREDLFDLAHAQYGFNYGIVFGELRSELDFWCGEA